MSQRVIPLVNNAEFLQWCRAFERPLIMGVLNVTPDSFSDGGHFTHPPAAIARIHAMINEGVDIIDIGGESTRPGAADISISEELDRVIPMIEYIRSCSSIAISIDTSKPEVMQAAVSAGAAMINDVYALQAPGALITASQLKVPICLVHMQGNPKNMQLNPVYPQGVIPSIQAFFSERIEACRMHGIASQQLILDPGFGFGKTIQDNLILTHAFSQFKTLGLPLLFGASRKSTIGALLHRSIDQRLSGSLSFAVCAVLKGANIIRTHDVAATKDAVMIAHLVDKAVDERRIG